MRYHELGSSGIRVSKMGLGTWAIGGGPAWGGDLNEQVCIDTIKEAINDGIGDILVLHHLKHRRYHNRACWVVWLKQLFLRNALCQ